MNIETTKREAGEIQLVLPCPPSVNICYVNCSHGRFKAKKYKEWENVSLVALNSQKTYRIHGDEWLEVEYTYYFPIHNKNGTKKKKDAFNYEKALSDFLEHNIEGFEDHKILRGTVKKIHSDRNEVEIIIRECEELYLSPSNICT